MDILGQQINTNRKNRLGETMRMVLETLQVNQAEGLPDPIVRFEMSITGIDRLKEAIPEGAEAAASIANLYGIEVREDRTLPDHILKMVSKSGEVVVVDFNQGVQYRVPGMSELTTPPQWFKSGV